MSKIERSQLVDSLEDGFAPSWRLARQSLLALAIQAGTHFLVWTWYHDFYWLLVVLTLTLYSFVLYIVFCSIVAVVSRHEDHHVAQSSLLLKLVETATGKKGGQA